MDCDSVHFFHSDDLPRRSFSFMEKRKQEFCDITFKVGNRSISAHRIILAAAIPYFYKIFCDKEMLDSEKQVITLSDVDPAALEYLIEFAYTCKVKITSENAKTLLSGACLLQVDEVRDSCCRFLAVRLRPENVLSVREYASNLNCPQLLKDTDSYVRDHFDEMSLRPDFLNIPFSFLNELISRDDLNVESEKSVFAITMKWVNRYPGERQEKLPDLLRNIRMPLLDHSFIRNHIGREELIRTSIPCRDLLDEATYYHLVPEEREEKVCTFSTKPRSFVRANVLQIFILYSKVRHEVECFDLVKEKWTTKVHHDMVLKLEHSVAQLHTKLYCFLPELTYVYDLEKMDFSFCKGMTYPRRWTGSVAHDSKLFVCGGFESNSPSKTAECFDPQTGEWTTLTCMHTSRGAPGVAACAGCIYVLGGRAKGTAVLDSAERCDLESGKWSMIPRMWVNRCGLGCAALGNRIYACGGETLNNVKVSTAEVFDTVANEWTLISSMSIPRVYCKLVSCCGNVYALGGSKHSNAIEIYNPKADEWRRGKSTNGKFTIVGTAVISVSSA